MKKNLCYFYKSNKRIWVPKTRTFSPLCWFNFSFVMLLCSHSRIVSRKKKTILKLDFKQFNFFSCRSQAHSLVLPVWRRDSRQHSLFVRDKMYTRRRGKKSYFREEEKKYRRQHDAFSIHKNEAIFKSSLLKMNFRFFLWEMKKTKKVPGNETGGNILNWKDIEGF